MIENILQSCKHWLAMIVTEILSNEGILKFMLEKTDIDINRKFCGDDYTLLLSAAKIGNEKVLKIILEKEEVLVNQADIQSREKVLVRGLVKFVFAVP